MLAAYNMTDAFPPQLIKQTDNMEKVWGKW